MHIYKRNIEALGKTHPHLVKVLKATIVDKEKIVISHSLSNELQVCYKKINGEEIVINDSNDLSVLPKKAAELIDQQDRTRIILLLGFGVGGYADELHAKLHDDGILIVYEAVPELFKAVLAVRDLSSLLGSDRFRLILGEDIEDLSFMSNYHRNILQGRFYVLNQRNCVALNESAYEKFRKKVTERKRLNDSMVFTGISRGVEWTEAFIRNIPVILRTPGVIQLKDLFQGRPAVIVSAGPSVEKNLHLLKEAKGRAIIIAVDVVVPTLLPAGIIPDFIIALEANRKLFRAFENNPLLRFCSLIIAAEVDYETMASRYPGPVFLNPSTHHPVMGWLSRFWENKGVIAAQGGSVSHTAFGLAEYLGASAIALIGQDLSFREKLHAGEVTRFFYTENDVEEYRRRNPMIKDIFGEERYTTGQFLAFRSSFEQMIKHFSGTVINATEGGLSIEGAQNMRLADFLEEYCQVSSVNVFDVVAPLGQMETEYKLSDLIAHIRDGIVKMQFISKTSEEIIECVKQLRRLKKKNMLKSKRAPRLIKEIEVRENIVEDPILCVTAPYRSSMKNYLRHDEIDDGTFDAIQDSLDYYGELVEVIEKITVTLKALLKSLEREYEVDDILADETIPAIDRYYRAGLIHSETGMVREAVRNLEQAAAEFSKIMDPDIQKKLWGLALSVHWMLARLYIKQNRFYESKEILLVLVDFAPESSELVDNFNKQSVAQLLEICETAIAIWETKQANMMKVLENATKEYGSHIESGNFYLRLRDYERAKTKYEEAIADAKILFDVRSYNSEEDSVQRVRLIASFYGLAQVHFARGDIKNAVVALDACSSYVSDVDMEEEIFSEIRGLIADLYEGCEKIGGDRSLPHNTAAI